MKYSFLLILLLVSITTNAQDASDTLLLRRFLSVMRAEESTYVCEKDRLFKASSDRKPNQVKVVSTNTFDSLYWKAASRIFTTQDFTKNNKAASTSFDENSKKLSISYAKQMKDSRAIWSAGINAEDANRKAFEFFGKDSWKGGISISGGWIQPAFWRSIYFDSKDCDNLRRIRNQEYLRILKRYQKVLSYRSGYIDSLREVAKDESGSIQNVNLDELPRVLSPDEKKILADYDELTALKNAPDSKSLLASFQDEITKLEVDSFSNFGFGLHWWAFNGSAGVNSYSIYDTAVKIGTKVDKKTLLKLNASVAYNYFRESARKRINYLSLSATAGNRFFMDELTANDISNLKSLNLPNGDALRTDAKGFILNGYENYKDMYGFLSVGGVYNYYPGRICKMERFLGFEFSASGTWKLFESNKLPKDKIKDVVSLGGGLLFTFESQKDKFAKTTFAILGRITDMPFDDMTIKDRVGVVVRVGIPFNY